MGKPFLSELDAMPGVYGWAERAEIGGLDEFTRKAAGRPLYVVGSGGSFSAAVFASLLHQSAGSISKAVTPLEFAGHTAIERESSVLIISAGGNNPDALSAFGIAQGFGSGKHRGAVRQYRGKAGRNGQSRQRPCMRHAAYRP